LGLSIHHLPHHPNPLAGTGIEECEIKDLLKIRSQEMYILWNKCHKKYYGISNAPSLHRGQEFPWEYHHNPAKNNLSQTPTVIKITRKKAAYNTTI